MSTDDNKRPARPVYRKLAIGVAVVSFVMAIVSALGLLAAGAKLFWTIVFLFVGFVFSTIAATGHWPPRSKP